MADFSFSQILKLLDGVWKPAVFLIFLLGVSSAVVLSFPAVATAVGIILMVGALYLAIKAQNPAADVLDNEVLGFGLVVVFIASAMFPEAVAVVGLTVMGVYALATYGNVFLAQEVVRLVQGIVAPSVVPVVVADAGELPAASVPGMFLAALHEKCPDDEVLMMEGDAFSVEFIALVTLLKDQPVDHETAGTFAEAVRIYDKWDAARTKRRKATPNQHGVAA